MFKLEYRDMTDIALSKSSSKMYQREPMSHTCISSVKEISTDYNNPLGIKSMKELKSE